MKVTIDLSPEEVAEILEYEYAEKDPDYLPTRMTAQEIKKKVIEHYMETSAAARRLWGKPGPFEWAKNIVRKARIWR